MKRKAKKKIAPTCDEKRTQSLISHTRTRHWYMKRKEKNKMNQPTKTTTVLEHEDRQTNKRFNWGTHNIKTQRSLKI